MLIFPVYNEHVLNDVIHQYIHSPVLLRMAVRSTLFLVTVEWKDTAAMNCLLVPLKPELEVPPGKQMRLQINTHIRFHVFSQKVLQKFTFSPVYGGNLVAVCTGALGVPWLRSFPPLLPCSL